MVGTRLVVIITGLVAAALAAAACVQAFQSPLVPFHNRIVGWGRVDNEPSSSLWSRRRKGNRSIESSSTRLLDESTSSSSSAQLEKEEEVNGSSGTNRNSRPLAERTDHADNHTSQQQDSASSSSTMPAAIATMLVKPSKQEEDWDIMTMNVEAEQLKRDEQYMAAAVRIAEKDGGENGPTSAYPNPTVGAILVAKDGRVLGQARSDYKNEAVRACLENAGLEMTPLTEWCVQWPQQSDLRLDLLHSTLYVTLEPFQERRGTALPPTTQLIQQAGIPRVVIGSLNPVPSRAAKGAAALHNAGIEVSILPDPSSSSSSTSTSTNDTGSSAVKESCDRLIQGYAQLANSKLQRMARQQFRQFQQPLGFLHCSVVDSQNVDAYARHGNAFGTFFNGKQLGFRNVGAYDIAPPPEVIWADDEDSNNDMNSAMGMEGSAANGEGGGNEDSAVWDVDFEDEDLQEELAKPNPMMPWYQQVDAVVATFPRPGHGPADDNSLTARLNGLRWLATHGNELPAGVERILVMDATDLIHLPLNNSNPHLPDGVNVESFWRANEKPRKPTRVLLRRGAHAQARAAAESAAAAAKSAAIAAQHAVDAVESGNAEAAAEAAVECQQAATAANDYILSQLQKSQTIKSQLEEMGVLVETIQGGEPVDVMRHLGKRHGYHSVVWRAGCWGDRGVRAVLDGAFQWISAHLAVDAIGGRFWQLMLAENAVQAAIGPTSKCRIFCDQNDLSLEYCDNDAADDDCSMTIDGRPVRHIRLDCRVALVDPDRPRELVMSKTAVFNKVVEEEAPWFL